MTKVIITSGGTKTAIDPVRHITNMSSGQFGSDIARAAIIAGMQVTYLVAENGKSPFTATVDLYQQTIETESPRLQALHEFTHQYKNHYREIRYEDFTDYAQKLEHLIQTEQPDIIILAAAVSDYLVANYSTQKIRSSEALQIQLKTAPKLIHGIRQLAPTAFIVGFKLLVNATDAELIAAAQKSITDNKLNLCVANDLLSLQQHQHTIIIVSADGSQHKVTNNLAAQLIATCQNGIRT